MPQMSFGYPFESLYVEIWGHKAFRSKLVRVDFNDMDKAIELADQYNHDWSCAIVYAPLGASNYHYWTPLYSTLSAKGYVANL